MSCFFFLHLLYIAFNPPASANCIGIAGVKGPAQNTIIADTAVQYQGLIINASNAQTITGSQKINSAKTIQRNISLVKTLDFNQRQHRFILFEIVVFIPFFRIIRSL